jgi:hypothetical protein
MSGMKRGGQAARRPGRAAEGLGERREAPEAEVADLRLGELPNGLQAIEDLKTCSAPARIDSAKAKTVMMIVTHVEADLEKNTTQPPTWHAKFRWILCHKNMGYHAMDPKIRTQGLNVGDLGSQRNTVTEASSHRTHNALRRETPSFTQVQGPRGEVKPLLPAFLYYDAIPREEYKVLVTEL